ncbi:MAG TPA: nucleoside triphosphate pyrophosphohydrolase [Kofleriaceae bacterium]|nr:nucleoside triphosphate pyrophosphohydrolase [Kofleriaceae bacterium]
MSTSETSRPGESLAALVEIMARLLAPGGCPWDREQTLQSLRPFLVEETFEVLEALETGTPAQHCEELGDLMMQIVFQAALREKEGAFGIDDVVRGISDKLVRRHPHVFADAVADSAEQVLVQWEEIKRSEKAARAEAGAPAPRTLAGVPLSLPALSRAHQVSAKAARVGFDWPDAQGCRDKVAEELGEIDRAMASGDRAAIEHEIGDLLFAAVSLARKLGVDAEGALRACTRRFGDRFAFIEDRLRERGKTPAESTLEEMDALWNQAKKGP